MCKRLHLYYRVLLSRGSNINIASAYSLFVPFMATCLFGFLLLWLVVRGFTAKPNLKDIIEALSISIVISIFFSIAASWGKERVSNSMIYSRCSGKANMNIKDLSGYRNLDYITQRKFAVAELVQKEFIEGIKNMVAYSKGEPIRFTTHKWIVDKVVNSLEVQKLYVVTGDKERISEKVMAQNVLLLVKGDYICRNGAWFTKHILKPIGYYEITLTPKPPALMCLKEKTH